MAKRETFRGYGPEQGYEFLRAAIAQNDYRNHGLDIADDEIFVSDGSKCDCGNILDILGSRNKIAMMDPVYPVYVDTNVMAGHTGAADEGGAYEGLVYLPCTSANGFVADIPAEHVDMVYLCYPNNPTGAGGDARATHQLGAVCAEEQGNPALRCRRTKRTSPTQPFLTSIYEIPGARECAIEFRSFSKNGGFTGTRCAFTVVPKSLMASTSDGRTSSLHPLWLRRSTTKFNGVSYPVQRAAEALYTSEGKAQVKELIQHYMGNAQILRKGAKAAG